MIAEENARREKVQKDIRIIHLNYVDIIQIQHIYTQLLNKLNGINYTLRFINASLSECSDKTITEFKTLEQIIDTKDKVD